MKTITVIRHAKSSWDYQGLSDYDRPLNDRGERNIDQMGVFLKEKGLIQDIIVSSPANRALTTAIGLSAYLGYEPRDIRLYNELYHAVTGDILEVIGKQDDKASNILLFGHNPGLTDFVNRYGNEYIENIPTAGVVILGFHIDQWSQLSGTKGTLSAFHFPKGISKDG